MTYVTALHLSLTNGTQPYERYHDNCSRLAIMDRAGLAGEKLVGILSLRPRSSRDSNFGPKWPLALQFKS